MLNGFESYATSRYGGVEAEFVRLEWLSDLHYSTKRLLTFGIGLSVVPCLIIWR